MASLHGLYQEEGGEMVLRGLEEPEQLASLTNLVGVRCAGESDIYLH